MGCSRLARRMAPWCSWPNTPPCQGGDRRFESARGRHSSPGAPIGAAIARHTAPETERVRANPASGTRLGRQRERRLGLRSGSQGGLISEQCRGAAPPTAGETWAGRCPLATWPCSVDIRASGGGIGPRWDPLEVVCGLAPPARGKTAPPVGTRGANPRLAYGDPPLTSHGRPYAVARPSMGEDPSCTWLIRSRDRLRSPGTS